MTQIELVPNSVAPSSADFEVLRVLPWLDEITDSAGYDPRSVYVEMFWLPVLGPSSIWLMRRMAICLEGMPNGFELSTSEVALELGIGNSSQKIPPIRKTLNRCSDFGLMHFADNNCAYVKKCFPKIGKRLEGRLSERLKKVHRLWTASQETASQETIQKEPTESHKIIDGYLALGGEGQEKG